MTTFGGSAALHPCLRCGACCAAFRVSFHWSEASDGFGTVPVELTTLVSPHVRAMRGTTDRTQMGCVALHGVIGGQVTCSVYGERPSPCREFAPSFENGVANERCDRARALHGLAPLRPEDFETPKPKRPQAPRKVA